MKAETKQNAKQKEEAYKALRTNVKHLAKSKGAKCFVITSAVSGEGKSDVALHLALALAAEEKRVLLVDCNLRSPALHRRLQVSGEKGLTELLQGSAATDEVIQSVKGLHFVAAGAGLESPSELLGKEKAAAQLCAWKQAYDFVILDTPAVGEVTDAAVVGEYADGALLVVKEYTATVRQAALAKSALEKAGISVLGAVMVANNNW